MYEFDKSLQFLCRNLKVQGIGNHVAEEIHITFTSKQAIAIIVSLLAISGAYPVANLITPEARYKSFTADDGEKLDDRLTINELIVEQILEADEDCRNRQDVMKSDLNWLRELVTTYQSSAKERDAGQDWKLEQCMRKLQ